MYSPHPANCGGADFIARRFSWTRPRFTAFSAVWFPEAPGN
ncbi:hypothetical protein BN1221_01813 [Brenneria goodwinii]|uniref:Uncharacterized protein n=1 Tax=Brenneria goodwinii TaxID=1109412 RepID=A0A0G4JTV2_9GAMM|nr:hypothetical protein BN1221_01813 [Brenneria goodwinii]